MRAMRPVDREVLMQPGRNSEQLERARNLRDLCDLGDPERWGGVGRIEIPVPRGVATDRTLQSAQFIRAQCGDLISRAWEVVAFWQLQGVEPNDAYQFKLIVTSGSGQATGTGNIILAPAAGIAPVLSPWETTATFGVVHLPEPLPACAIAIRAELRVVAAGGDPAHTFIANVQAAIAPRALI